jgi:hypothetical protein
LVGAPLVFVYRPDLLEKAGFREPPATWADLAACARAVAGTGGMPEGLQALYVEDVEQVVLTILVQQGDGLMRDNGFAPVFERVGETMDAVRPLLSFSGGGRREDNIELAAMAIGSPGFLNEIPRGMRSKWRIAPLPSSGKQVQSPYQMTYLAVRSAGPAYEAASWEFVKWLVRADAPRPGAVAGLGCRKSFAPGDEYLFQGIEHLWASLGQIVDYGPNNLMNRRAGLETLADAVEGLFEGRRNSSPGYGEILSKANGLMTVIHAPSRPAYALYR